VGSCRSLDHGERYQLKRIVVKRGGRLSLQMHHHRAELLGGRAWHRAGDYRGKCTFLHENESIYVPSGARHRLENPGKIDLELIEVQTGAISTSCVSRTTITARESAPRGKEDSSPTKNAS
jgi:mannose-6-phosphate isomerase-like protein (cupin superfamily)